MCYYVEFGHSTSKGVNINRGEPKNWGVQGLQPLGMGSVADPKEHAPPPCIILPNMVILC